MADARLQIPPRIKRGEPFQVKILIRHPMETGYRLTDEGKPVARNVIRQISCRYGGLEVFRAEPSSGISANPIFSFFVTARDTGELLIEWVDDSGTKENERGVVTVTD